MPFKPFGATPLTHYHVNESMAISEQADKIREILDAKCVAADLESVCSDQAHLNKDEQTGLLKLLRKYKDLFDGTLGRWTGDPVVI